MLRDIAVRNKEGVVKMIASNKYIESDIQTKFEFHDFGHALEILHESFPEEWREIQDSLRQLKLTTDDISKAGGNESPIPKKFDDVFFDLLLQHTLKICFLCYINCLSF